MNGDGDNGRDASSDAPPLTRRLTVSRRATLGSMIGLAVSSSSSQGPADVDQVRADRRSGSPDFILPEQHGALGDGVTDDTAALQAALDTGRSIGLTVGRTYLVTSALRWSADNVTLTGGGRIKIARRFDVASDRDNGGTHMRALFVTGANASIIGVDFDATEAPIGSAVENGLIWSRAASTTIRGCRFVGNPKGTCIWGLGDAPYLSVQDCRFQSCSGAVFTKGRNTIISGNIIVDATDAAIAINGRSCIGAVIVNNTINNERLVPIPSMIAVEDSASGWTISGNTLIGVNGGGIVCLNVLDETRVKGGVIADNIIDARDIDGRIPSNRNPAAMIAVSASYLDWSIHDNIITACAKGNSNSRLIIVAASGGILHDNIIDGSAVAGLSAVIEISAASEGVIVQNNKSRIAKDGRHYLLGSGNYVLPCRFSGGWMLGGQEGINAEMNATRIRGLILEIDNINESSAANLVNAYTLLGDRCRFLNEGAQARPHRVGRHTDMYATDRPQAAGTTPFQIGDRFHFLHPQAGGGIGVVRTSGGWMRF